MKDTGLQQFREAVESFSQKCTGLWRKPNRQFKAWLESHRLPLWLKRHVMAGCLARTTQVGLAYFLSPGAIRKQNEAYPELRRHGFFQIGSASDGDPLVVRFTGEPGAVGYISHDALWRDPEDREVLFLKVAPSIGAYALMAKKVEGCPIDYYGDTPK